MKIKHLLIGMLAMAAAVACKQDEPVEEPVLEVYKSTIKVDATDGETTFTVTANNPWTATSEEDWVSIDPASGDGSKEAVTVTVTAEDNPTDEKRTAKIIVKSGSLKKTVKLTQAAGESEPENPEPENPEPENPEPENPEPENPEPENPEPENPEPENPEPENPEPENPEPENPEPENPEPENPEPENPEPENPEPENPEPENPEPENPEPENPEPENPEPENPEPENPEPENPEPENPEPENPEPENPEPENPEPEPEPVVPSTTKVVEFKLSEMAWPNNYSHVANEKIYINDDIAIRFRNGGATTSPTYITDGEFVKMFQNSDTHKGNTLEVMSNEHTDYVETKYNIKSIEITFAQGHCYLTPDCGEFSAEGDVRTWTGSAVNVMFTATGADRNHRAYVHSIKVVYEQL